MRINKQILFLALLLLFSLTACQSVKNAETTSTSEITSETQTTAEVQTEETTKQSEMRIKITAGEYTFTATLYDNEAGKAVWDMLPMTLPMMNLYSREMCYRMGSGSLPENEAKEKGYDIGDIIYWPPQGSFVILYEQNEEVFKQQPIGHTDDDISFFNGMADTDITFEKAE